MERRTLESAAVKYSFLRGLLLVPLGALLIVSALGNWSWGPLAHAWVFGLCALAAAAAALYIDRYYAEHFGRIGTTFAQQARTVAVGAAAVAVMVSGALLLRSRASWSLDLPVNPTLASFGLFMLAYYGLTVGLRAHQRIVWGGLLVAGLLPAWGGMSLSTASNVGLVVCGCACVLAGPLDHRALARDLPPQGSSA